MKCRGSGGSPSISVSRCGQAELAETHGIHRAEGEVAEIKEGRAEVTSSKGNTIGKNGTEEDPAVVIERPGVSC